MAIVNRCPRFPPQNISNRDGDDTRGLATTGPKRAMDSRIVSAHQRESELGVHEVSSALFNRVTNYHAQIGANVNKETLQSLEWQALCHRTL